MSLFERIKELSRARSLRLTILLAVGLGFLLLDWVRAHPRTALGVLGLALLWVWCGGESESRIGYSPRASRLER